MSNRSWLDAEPSTTAPSRFRDNYLPEYRRRLLAIYDACNGWSHADVEPLWPYVSEAQDAFGRADVDTWSRALTTLEKATGIAGS